MSAQLLVVAGSDPTHGAGIDADREAAAHFDLATTCVVTAWTDQDGTNVRSLGARPPEDWLAEARAAWRASAIAPIAALKSGLLPGASAVRALASLLDELATRPVPVVVDPVLAASGGEPFLDDEGIAALLDELVTRGVILTPNLPEAARLTATDLATLQTSRAARLASARTLLERGALAVVLKDGHGSGPEVADLLCERGASPLWFARPRVPGARLHGSGCRFASALAAQLARGIPLPRAAAAAGAYLGHLLLARALPERGLAPKDGRL